MSYTESCQNVANLRLLSKASLFTHLCRNSLDRYISYIRSVRLAFITIMFVEMSELNENSVDPDLRRLILVYIVCQCPFYGTLG